MFEPETEDMLPRMAPKPSPDAPSGASEGIIKPQVPEVSILFGQNNNLQKQLSVAAQNQEKKVLPQQTYAAWKKQMLPKVTYPASEEINAKYSNPSTNLYPMRTTSSNLNGFIVNNGCSAHQLPYSRNIESCNNKVCQQIQHLPLLSQPQPALVTLNQLSTANSKDILTICAGTQTDAILDSSCCMKQLHFDILQNLASKKDVEIVREILGEVKAKQELMCKMLEQLVLGQYSQLTMKSQCDIGIQVDEPPSNIVETVEDKPALLKNKFLQHLNPGNNVLQTPRGKPVAQSTTYRPNSPQYDFIQQNVAEAVVSTKNQFSNNPMCKSSSDTSLAMNELALKYLPNEKLAELLKELNIDCPLTTNNNEPSATARANTDRFEKSSSDISNASYKYLKKYRLLPDDYEENVNNNRDDVVENHKQILQYNSSRNIATNSRQTPTNKCPPCVSRLPLSPLVSPQHVNLEDIKHQPKFL